MNAPNRWQADPPDRRAIDLRSDTVTRPTPGMLAAMANAAVGDDVYGEDPTIQTLEARVADLLNKEAALFVPSGTQSNLIGLLVHCNRGDEILLGDRYHTFSHEARGASVLGGVALTPLPTDAHGGLRPEQIHAAVHDNDPHYPVTRLLALENTVCGHAQSPAAHQALTRAARRQGLTTHLDGARLFNAAIALNHPPDALAQPFDTVSICLSKGLGAPMGSVLSGPQPLIDHGRRLRKLLGGGLRQAGFMGACGLYALDHHIDRLAQDHANAARLAAGLDAIPQVTAHAFTNMVMLSIPTPHHRRLAAYLATRRIRIGAPRPAIRLVTHLDITTADIDHVISTVQRYFSATPPADTP